MDSNEIVEVILFYCYGSQVCEDTIKEINAQQIPLKISSCNIITKRARSIIKNMGLGIDRVPSMMVVKSDGSADIFQGRRKIVSWIQSLSGSDEPEEEDYEEERVVRKSKKSVVRPNPTKKKVDIEFIYPIKGKPVNRPVREDIVKARIMETRMTAKKMEEDMKNTLGYYKDKSVVNEEDFKPQIYDEEIGTTELD